MRHGKTLLAAVALLVVMSSLSSSGEESPTAEKDAPPRGDTFQQAAARQAALVARAWTAESAGQMESALALYREAVAIGAPGESLEYAWFGVGRCEARRGRLWSAFEALERSYPPSYVPDEVERRVALEMRIGRALMALEGGEVPDLPPGEKSRSGYAAASRVFQRVVYNLPNGQEAAGALLLRGDCLRAMGDLAEAEIAYRRAMRRREESLDGWRATLTLAELLVRTAPEDAGRVERLTEAAALLESVETSPRAAEALADELNRARRLLEETRAADALDKAQFYLERGDARHRQAGIFALREVVRLYPGTAAAGTAADRLADLGVEPAEDPVPATEGPRK